MRSRQYFVQQVAQTIQENHGKHGESFIFGISGKWGEGKTHFLNDLEKALKTRDRSFEVFWINPWKFATDKTSFLRNFLRETHQTPKEWQRRLEQSIWGENNLDALDSDITRNGINVRWLLMTLALLIVIAGLYLAIQANYFGISEGLRAFIIQWKWLASLILLPVVIAFIGSIITTSKTDHAFSTLDRFDDLLEGNIKEADYRKQKLLIFVDDLDRVTPQIARDVLDNLRTFFDKPALSFIVTGDHTVLERYLGNDLLPDGTPPEQREEGRRFLKKIFNFYWNLPQPIDQELDEFLGGQFNERSAALSTIFKKPEEQKQFKEYLRKYFDKNFRQIIRFLDMVAFTFEIIEDKLKAVDEAEKKYLRELPEHPLLVIRVLMIQELCTPLFDKILGNRQLLADLEYAAETKDAGKINSLITPFQAQLSPFQDTFIRTFIYEEPHFYRGTSLIVSDIRPFLYLAADASFGDSRGPSQDDFMKILNGGDPTQVKDSLLSTGDQKARDGAKAFVAHIPTLSPANAAIGLFRTLLVALSEIPREYSIHKIFAEELSKLDYSFINSHNVPQEKMEILRLFWGWLDSLDAALTAPFEEKFPFSDNLEVAPIDPVKAGPFTIKALAGWMRTYYAQNPMDALNKMVNLFGQFNEEYLGIIRAQMADIEDAVASDVIRDSTPGFRDTRLAFLRYTPEGTKTLWGKVVLALEEMNGNVTQWAMSKAGPDTWSREEINKVFANRLKSVGDFNALRALLDFMVGQGVLPSEKIWDNISAAVVDQLVENLPAVIESPYSSVAPPEEMAQKLMDKLVEKIKEGDDARRLQLIPCIRRGKWPWTHLAKRPARNRFNAAAESENEQVKNVLSEALATWDNKDQ